MHGIAGTVSVLFQNSGSVLMYNRLAVNCQSKYRPVSGMPALAFFRERFHARSGQDHAGRPALRDF